MKRRIMAALLAAAMLLSVAACSSGGESSAGGEAQESTGGAAGTTESTAGEGAADGDTGLTYDGEEVTITYWHTHGDAAGHSERPVRGRDDRRRFHDR